MSDIRGSYIKFKKLIVACDFFGKNVYNHHYQRVLFHRRRVESIERFIVKAVISKILYEESVSFVTEWRYKIDGKVFDSLPIIDIDKGLIYRFGSAKIDIRHKNFKEMKIDVAELIPDSKWLRELENKVREKLGYETNLKT